MNNRLILLLLWFLASCALIADALPAPSSWFQKFWSRLTGKSDLLKKQIFLYPTTSRYASEESLKRISLTSTQAWIQLPVVTRALQEQRLLQVDLRGILYESETDLSREALVKLVKGFSFASGQLDSMDTPTMDRRLRLFLAESLENERNFRLRVWPNTNNSVKIPFGSSAPLNINAAHQSLGKVSLNTDDNGYFSTLLLVELVENLDDLNQNSMETPEFWVRMPKSMVNSRRAGSAPVFQLNAGILAKDEQESSDKSGVVSLSMMVTQTPVVVTPNESNIMVITDIDDTIKVSNITAPTEGIVEAAIFQPYKAVEGMSDFFKNLIEQVKLMNPALRQLDFIDTKVPRQISFHYVSGVSWPLVPPYMNEFMIPFSFPMGSIWAKNTLFSIQDAILDLAQRSSTALKKIINAVDGDRNEFKKPENSKSDGKVQSSSTYRHKMKAIQYLFDTSSPPTSFLLLGDSTQYDPEVYADLTRIYGWSNNATGNAGKSQGKISCVLIRAVFPIKSPPSEDNTPVNVGVTPEKCTKLSETEKCLPSRTIKEKMFTYQLIQRLRAIFDGVPSFEERVRLFRSGEDLKNFNLFSNSCY